MPRSIRNPSRRSGHIRCTRAPFAIGQAGITVTYGVPWPANLRYVVCTYFDVSNKTPASFQAQHERCDSGAPVALDTAGSLDRIACPVQQ